MSGVIVVTDNRPDALARLDVFVGDWTLEARFPGDPPAPPGTPGAPGGGPVARARFEWTLDGQFLLQHTEVPIPEAPDSLTIVAADPRTGGYTFSADRNTITGAWEKSHDGGDWEHDFALTYRKAS